jgi:hypothetical protein
MRCAQTRRDLCSVVQKLRTLEQKLYHPLWRCRQWLRNSPSILKAYGKIETWVRRASMAERESIRLAIDVEALETEAVKVDFIDFSDLAASFDKICASACNRVRCGYRIAPRVSPESLFRKRFTRELGPQFVQKRCVSLPLRQRFFPIHFGEFVGRDDFRAASLSCARVTCNSKLRLPSYKLTMLSHIFFAATTSLLS